jgi:hypothetical protein
MTDVETLLRGALPRQPRNMILTYSKRDADLVAAWLAARDNEKTNAKVYHGERPCLPAKVALTLAERIWRKRK